MSKSFLRPLIRDAAYFIYVMRVLKPRPAGCSEHGVGNYLTERARIGYTARSPNSQATPMLSKAADSSPLQDAHVMQGEHDEQIKLLSAFGDAVSRQQSMAELEEICKQLMDYTSTHFLSEQLLMRMYAYPDYEQHEQRHTRLMERIGTLQESLADGDRDRMLTTVQHLRDGILGHIEQDDAALAHYLQQGLATHR